MKGAVVPAQEQILALLDAAGVGPGEDGLFGDRCGDISVRRMVSSSALITASLSPASIGVVSGGLSRVGPWALCRPMAAESA
jgi:hypothetical protein